VSTDDERVTRLEQQVNELTRRFEALEATFNQNSPYSSVAQAPGVRPPTSKS
jgi:hypothetical protein